MTIKAVVPISGGKDSQACLVLAILEFGKNHVLGLFCDTQFEHPLTYQHVDRIAELYGVEIRRICAGSVQEQVIKYGRFPGGGARHCTDALKIQPSKKFYSEFAKENGPFQVWYGMRAEESHERSQRYSGKVSDDLYMPHDVMDKYPKYLGEKLGVMFRMPVLYWSRAEIITLLDGNENPLYKAGFDRVGCFPCLAGGDGWKEKAFAFDNFGQEQYIKVRYMEEIIGKSVFTSKGGAQRNNPNQGRLFEGSGCQFCEI
jgi:3'-phosphoadenosine 5'-phosphosulfate sulfotransferase (PAPS reductase)/FAD synthetase